jgi:predicted nucleic acid-binding protein
MYLVGQDHPHKQRASELLERFVEARERLVTDAEVFQEILHRYTAIRRRDAIEPAWRVLADLADEVFAIDLDRVEAARTLLIQNEQLSARDAIHVAVMAAQGVERILSFDTGFDRVESVRRVF